MNRYRAGGPSKASATTICQKCLKRGHYSYECSAAQQERPYVSRPSRSQQLLNPKLAPKLSSSMPEIKDEAKKLEARPKPDNEDASRGGKRSLDAEDDFGGRRKRRSVSSYSSDSVSTISTNRFRSRSPTPPRQSNKDRKRLADRLRRSPSGNARSHDREQSHRKHRSDSRSRTPPRRRKAIRDRSPDRKRRSISSGPRSRSPPRRSKEQLRRRSRSPVRRSFDSGSRWDKKPDLKFQRARDETPPPVHREDDNVRPGAPPKEPPRRPSPPRERSLSPYSRRVAMTRAMGGA